MFTYESESVISTVISKLQDFSSQGHEQSRTLR